MTALWTVTMAERPIAPGKVRVLSPPGTQRFRGLFLCAAISSNDIRTSAYLSLQRIRLAYCAARLADGVPR
jgi:hypothetical protein